MELMPRTVCPIFIIAYSNFKVKFFVERRL